MNSSTPYKNGTPRKVDASEIESGVQWVKAGADSKQQALLVRPGALKQICMAMTLLVILVVSVLGWSVRRVGDLEERAAESKLRHAIRATAQRVGLVERIKDRLSNSGTALENVNVQELVKTLDLNSELRTAHKDHEKSQAQMMARLDELGMQVRSAKADEKVSNSVPEHMQRRMLDEFAQKASFMLHFTEVRKSLPQSQPTSSRSPAVLSAPLRTEWLVPLAVTAVVPGAFCNLLGC